LVAENAGIPSVIEGFSNTVKAIGRNAGFPDLRVAEYPGVIALHSQETIEKHVEDILVDRVVAGLTTRNSVSPVRKADEQPGDRDIVFGGRFGEVNEYFHKNGWSDGLPIVPPTRESVEEFLAFTEREPDEVLGILHPGQTEATVWKIAVNGVMAGCRPEYMPILIAIVEVMAMPQYGMKHGGSSPGWEAMIILNGPIARQLDFNHKWAVQRPGNQANTSIGRFYRLFSRNVARFLPGTTDMATFGQMFRAVVAENEETCNAIGWRPLHVMQGYAPEDNVVTLTSIRAVGDPFVTAGESAEQHLDYMVDWVKRMIEPYQSSHGYVETNVLLISPIVAAHLAKSGYSKQAVADYLTRNAVVPAHYYEWNMQVGVTAHPKGTTIRDLVAKGVLPKEWHLSDDPNRMVPLLLPESRLLIVVTGDPTRSRCLFLRENFKQGYATSAKVVLPGAWDTMLENARSGLGH
jgi:hypothetical protein